MKLLKNDSFQYYRTLTKKCSVGVFLIVNLHEMNSIFLPYIVYKNHQNPFHSLARRISTKYLITEIQNFGIHPKIHLRTVAEAEREHAMHSARAS